MADPTPTNDDLDSGDGRPGADLLPLVYAELHSLAAAQLAREAPGQTLQPTALVHEAYLRLTSGGDPPRWRDKGQFFAAAAEAMRRILIEAARRRKATRRGGEFRRSNVDLDTIAKIDAPDHLLAMDAALERFAVLEPEKAELVKLRCFAGCTLGEAAQALGISRRQDDRFWAYAKAWLRVEIGKIDPV